MPFLDGDEVARSLTGAWRVFLDKPDAPRFFDLSVEGFWRSFRAFALMIPLYAVMAVADYQSLIADNADFSDSAFILARTAAAGIDWILFPILLALIAEPLGITRSYTSFVIARNWGSVLTIVPFAVVDLLYSLGVFEGDARQIATLVVLMVQLRYSYLIASRSLGVGIGLAVALVVGDFAISQMIVVISAGIAGLPF
jgi:hypothetical protein